MTTIAERSEKLRWALARLPLASDAEATHDARVSLRRLRAAATGFAGCLVQARQWRRQLRRAERELGGLRDAEVRLALLEEVLGPVAVWRDRSDDPGAPIIGDGPSGTRHGLRGLEAEARRTLADSTAAEIAELRSRALSEKAAKRLQRVAAGPVVQKGGVDPTAASLGARQLPQLFKRARRQTRTEAELHQRRGEIRKLRYRLELFAPVLGPGQRTVLQELRELQGLLGRFHDLAVLADQIDGSSRELRHELRPALRRLALRVELERQVAKEAAQAELGRIDQADWWAAAQAACLEPEREQTG